MNASIHPLFHNISAHTYVPLLLPHLKGFAGKEHDMNRIITIGREFGSGGRELNTQLRKSYRIPYYNQEIITEIAKRTALSEDYIRQIEEKRPIMHFPIHTGHSLSDLRALVLSGILHLHKAA